MGFTETKVLSDLDFLNNRSSRDNEKALIFHTDPKKACENSHAVAIITEWDEFRNINFEKIAKYLIKPTWLFDTRSISNFKDAKKFGLKVWVLGTGEI